MKIEIACNEIQESGSLVKKEQPQGKRVYLDVCALCRPFDDQRHLRIRLETDAVYLILERIRQGEYTLVVSPVHLAEVQASAEQGEANQVLDFLGTYGHSFDWDVAKIKRRAEELAWLKFGVADAAHVAYAEESGSIFVTCDDALLRKIRKIRTNLRSSGILEFVGSEGLQ